MHYVPRVLAQTIRRAMSTFPAVLVTGARQTGKTTLLRTEFGDAYRYLSLERPDVRARALADPVAFLNEVWRSSDSGRESSTHRPAPLHQGPH